MLLQEDLDCFHLACFYGNLEVVRELAVRQKVDLHTVKEVCAQEHVYASRDCDRLYKCI